MAHRLLRSSAEGGQLVAQPPRLRERQPGRLAGGWKRGAGGRRGSRRLVPAEIGERLSRGFGWPHHGTERLMLRICGCRCGGGPGRVPDHARRSEEHTSELQSRENLVCRLLLE